ncbi:glutathione S-transferase family protein [Massilia phosphatilytica]|nr:glutathione S-transferase family protein [Massilia phosphatilytica]
MNSPLVLVSHALCPYVQRAAIVLHEKGVPFERRDVDLADKPDWFLQVSPLGKTPVLLADGEAIFESAVICEYLDETVAPRLHPLEPLQRARHRGWMEFGSALLNAIAVFYNAPDEAALLRAADDIHRRFRQIEQVMHAPPYFDGARFCIVDAVFAPIFRYLDVFERIGDLGMLAGLAKVQAWRAALAQRPSVQAAVSLRYPELLTEFLARRGSALSLRMQE